MYAVNPNGWQNIGYEDTGTSDYRATKGDNWMYMGDIEWTITRQSDITNRSFVVSYFGHADSPYVRGNYGVRPVFYLNSDVEFEGGSGSATDPYVIAD